MSFVQLRSDDDRRSNFDRNRTKKNNDISCDKRKFTFFCLSNNY